MGSIIFEALVQQLESDSMTIGRIINFVSQQLKLNNGIAVEQSSPGQFDFEGPRMLLTEDVEGVAIDKKKADSNIIPTSNRAVRFGLLRESTRFAQMDYQRQQLEEKFTNREIQVSPKFTFDNWPTDPLMTHMRQLVARRVTAYESKHHPLCDDKDLKYQTLFRLTTIDVATLFDGGQELNEYLIQMGAYTNWRNILRLDPQFIGNFGLNEQVVDDAIEEQHRIIKHRLESSSLDLEEILRPKGIFSEAGWVIQRRNGAINAIQEDTANAFFDAVPLEFREIETEQAAAYHRDLHYIHTPRADLAFGLFVQDEELPFSVVALEKIDRDYKRNVLAFQGYDSRECYDLTRLYSKPGTPGNTSSSMFALAFQHLRENYPDTQAILSSFMPSYATGVSMTSGGFNNPVMIKPLSHRFVETSINGEPHYEHMTNRRMKAREGKVIRSRVPLLPTVELMTNLRPPRHKPLPGADEFMLETY